MTSPAQGEHAQPEALRLAEMLEDAPLWESQAPTIAGFRVDDDSTLGDAAAELRRLHAQVAALTAAPQGGAEAPKVYLSVNQLLQAIKFATGGGPANADELETSIGFQIGASQDDEGKVIHGMRCWLADYPEEGVYPLDEEPTAKDLAAHALRASHGQAPAAEALQADLVAECERAMRQREEFLKTGVSTASHGGSHDTCFPAILRKHGVIAPAAGAVAGPIGYALAYPNGKPIFSFSGPNLRTSLAEAQEMSRLHLGSGEPIAVYTAAPTPAAQGDALSPTQTVEITHEQIQRGLAAAFKHPRAAAPDAVFKAGVDFGVSVALLQTPRAPAAQGDALDRVTNFRHEAEGMVRGGEWVRLSDVRAALAQKEVPNGN